MYKDSWNPQQYEKFKDERSQPFFDLMALLRPQEQCQVIDLGCGTGELTAALHRHLNAKTTTGLDSSKLMLKRAQLITAAGLEFKEGLIETWKSPSTFDVIFSNAALQWCKEHQQLFKNFKESLRPRGQLAVQMPMNHDYPTHVLASEMSREEPWATLLKNDNYDKQKSILLPEQYGALLFNLGFKEQNVFLRVYVHNLESRESVIEWVKGTTLTHFQSRLSELDYQKFLKEYQDRLFEMIPNDRPFFYPFKRILIWGRL